MDFEFTPQQKALRKEFEDFAREEAARAPAGFLGSEDRFSKEGNPYYRDVVKKAAARGWLSLAWPTEYGGAGHGVIEQLIFNEVMAYWDVPAMPDLYMSLAGGIMFYGSDEQKKQWLPPMSRGEIHWAEGLSEPDAGSDLASLKTRAVEDGDSWVLNGQKVWTSGGHCADHIFILARTNPDPAVRHRGLTFFVNKIGPGIEFRPLLYMNGDYTFNETYIDNFRVPKTNIIGGVNGGWKVTMAGRNFARANINRPARGKRMLDELLKYCKEAGLAGNPIVRQKLAELVAANAAALRNAYHIGWSQVQGEDVSGPAACCGFFSNDLNVKIARTGLELMGLYGVVAPGSKWAPLKGRFEVNIQWMPGFTIAGGTAQIRRNVLVNYLGLPKAGRD